MKNKKCLLKILFVLLILMLSSNTFVFATTNDPFDGGDIFDGIIGVLLLGPKYLFILVGVLIELILSLVMGVSLTSDLTPLNILFNKVELLKLDFFYFNVVGGDATLEIIKQNIKIWYNALRNFAIGAELIILVYIGIRMSLSTLADDKAKYKKLLRFWIESFVLLFLLQYIMIIVLELNNQIVQIMVNANASLNGSNGLTIIDEIEKVMHEISTKGFAYGVLYFAIMLITLMYFVMYLKRMLVVGFLVVIAPLITISYSLDKIGDGKSQALSTWLKQFMYNVLIQPFHCVLYLVFASTTFEIIQNSVDLEAFKNVFLAIIILAFILQAEKIVKEIFGFNAASSTMMEGMAAGAMIGKGMDIGKKGLSNIKNTGKAIGNIRTKNGTRLKNTKPGKWVHNRLHPVKAWGEKTDENGVKRKDKGLYRFGSDLKAVYDATGAKGAGSKALAATTAYLTTGQETSAIAAWQSAGGASGSGSSSVDDVKTKQEEDIRETTETLTANHEMDTANFPDGIKTSGDLNNLRKELNDMLDAMKKSVVSGIEDKNPGTKDFRSAIENAIAEKVSAFETTSDLPAGFIQNLGSQLESKFLQLNSANKIGNFNIESMAVDLSQAVYKVNDENFPEDTFGTIHKAQAASRKKSEKRINNNFKQS